MHLNLRRSLIAAALSLAPALAQTPAPAFVHPVFPGAETTLGQEVTAIVTDPSVSRAHFGVAVTALDGTPIFGLNEGQYFRPASNTKLYTTSAATALLGLNSTVTTYVDADAPIAKGTIKGNVSLHGVGDANLSGRPIPYQTPAEVKAAAEQHIAPPDPLRYIDEIAANIAATGVKKITGDIIGDDSLWRWEPYPGSWAIDDMVGYDGSPTAALTIDDNQLDVTVTPGAKVGDPATVTFTPDVGFYKLDAEVTTVAAPAQGSGRGARGGADGPRLKIDREIGSRTLQIFGTVAIGQPRTQSIAITDPAEFAAMALKQKLEAHGVKVEGVARAKHRIDKTTMGYMAEVNAPAKPTDVPASASTIPVASVTGLKPQDKPLYVEHKSITLAEDLAVTLKVSQNLHAELFLRRLSPAGDMGLAPGAHVERQWLVSTAGLDPADIVLYDGSGMSSHNLVTPRTTAALLAYDAQQAWFPTYKAALPVGGVDGTISTRFHDAPLKGHVFAKTGTLGESRALSGYLDCASGKQVIFSIMVDTHSPLGGADRVAMDKIVAAIAAGN
jgi:D-alanyl-D-alanine carboxypeptidase/D-alanyl-D-alanine-endopeptidase (penicillin-binding protein 4)